MRGALRRIVAVGSLLLGVAGCGVDPNTPGTQAEPIRVCATGVVTEGIDVSVYQGTINWTSVRNAGKRFAIIRVSDGLSLDTKFDLNWTNARAAGVVRGVYQYFRPGRDPIAQADLLLSKMGTLEPNDLPPSIDVEATDGQTPAVINEKIHQWVDRVRAVTGREPIVYTGLYFWPASVGTSDFQQLPLWIPQYGPTCPSLPAPWTSWAIFQYSSTGAVGGISGNVDLNQFNGDFAALETFVRNSVSTGRDAGVDSGDARVDATTDGGRADVTDVLDTGPRERAAGVDGVGCNCSVRTSSRGLDKRAWWRVLLVGVGLVLAHRPTRRRALDRVRCDQRW